MAHLADRAKCDFGLANFDLPDLCKKRKKSHRERGIFLNSKLNKSNLFYISPKIMLGSFELKLNQLSLFKSRLPRRRSEDTQKSLGREITSRNHIWRHLPNQRPGVPEAVAHPEIVMGNGN